MAKLRKQFLLTPALAVALKRLQARWALPTMVQTIEQMIRICCKAEQIDI
jgi:hypothetical protein